MECLIQYLDELEDLYYAVALVAERIRRAFRALIVLAVSATFPALGVLLAVTHPPLAGAMVLLSVTGLLYRAAVGSPRAVSAG
ncbi:MAG TPA: hypothetical protein VGA68_00315 [Woeseiaceae bacterium]|jgi:hypothetical protein